MGKTISDADYALFRVLMKRHIRTHLMTQVSQNTPTEKLTKLTRGTI